ncbi:hypothetical protein [Nonomuraea sp. NPDC050643]|uniref:hypothetical protein n=1 Tax=Nonomuraea sp. NPDC050643 TaxID=3155660 RepID=UPI0033EF6969
MNWIDEPIVDPGIPERDRWRLIGASTLLLGRPEPAPPRWARRLFALGAATAAAGGAALSLAAVQTGHESTGFAALMVFLTALIFIGVARPSMGQRLAGQYGDHYVIPVELDAPALELVTRARKAIDEVTASRVHHLGLLDGIANDIVLPERLWEVARLVRIQATLRAEQAEAMTELMTPELTAVLEPQREALNRSVAAVTERVWDLETYAARVREADSALRASELQKSNDKYRDLLAQTGDTAGLRDLADQADTLTRSLREAITAGQTLSL